MARKSKYDLEQEELKILAPEVYKAGLYRRLSIEDGDDIMNNSIGNQKKIADDFVNHASFLRIEKVYTDNGFTGMNYKRPGFQQMLKDLEAGIIDTIIVKDISRLGRHFILTSELVEKTLPSMGVRLICINDNYDSSEPDADTVSLLLPIKMIMNDNYARDFSKKIKTSIHTKMNNGEFLPAAGSIPYGYLRNAEKMTFDLDAETAPVVRKIYEMRAGGMKFNAIAKVLNDEGIPSPGKIRFIRGLTKSSKFENSLWIRGTIRKILEDQVYIGFRIHGKVKKDRLEQNKTRRDESEWQIIEDAHEAIVSRELFDQVQQVNEEAIKKQASFEKREDVTNDKRALLQDKVFCGDCGSKMSARKAVGRKKSERAIAKCKKEGKVPDSPAYIFFDCNRYVDSGKRACKLHYIRQEAIMKAIEDCMNQHLNIALNFEDFMKTVRQMPKVIKHSNNTLQTLASERAKKSNLEAKKEQLISDLSTKMIDKVEFDFMKKRLDSQLLQVNLNIQKASEDANALNSFQKSSEAWIQSLKKYKKFQEIDRELVDLIIERILIYDNKTVKLELKIRDPFIAVKEYVESIGEVVKDAS